MLRWDAEGTATRFEIGGPRSAVDPRDAVRSRSGAVAVVISAVCSRRAWLYRAGGGCMSEERERERERERGNTSTLKRRIFS